jgi:hypothetical protein
MGSAPTNFSAAMNMMTWRQKTNGLTVLYSTNAAFPVSLAHDQASGQLSVQLYIDVFSQKVYSNFQRSVL